MISSLLEFFRMKKETFVKEHVSREDYRSGWLNTSSGTYWPSTWDEVKVDEIDWEAFEKAVLEFEESFKEDGENAHRNPLNKEPK